MMVKLSLDAVKEAVRKHIEETSVGMLAGADIDRLTGMIGGRPYDLEGFQIVLSDKTEQAPPCPVERATKTGMTLRLATVEGKEVA